MRCILDLTAVVLTKVAHPLLHALCTMDIKNAYRLAHQVQKISLVKATSSGQLYFTLDGMDKFLAGNEATKQ